MCLSCLKEINGGCEKILPVSLSFWSKCGWLMSVNGTLSFFSFFFVVLTVAQSVEHGVEPC